MQTGPPELATACLGFLIIITIVCISIVLRWQASNIYDVFVRFEEIIRKREFHKLNSLFSHT